MYRNETPFTRGQREIGYKDNLIVASIIEYFTKNSHEDNIFFLTKNIIDFVSDATLDKTKILKLHEAFNQDQISVVSSEAILFQELSKNLENSQKNKNTIISKKLISTRINKAIEEDFLLFEHDILGSYLLFIDEYKLSCEAKEMNIETNEEIEILEISGIMDVTIEISFQLEDFEVKSISSSNLIFKNEILKAIQDKNLHNNEEWPYKFEKIKKTQEFAFNYLDMSYQRKNYLDAETTNQQFDPVFLSIAKI